MPWPLLKNSPLTSIFHNNYQLQPQLSKTADLLQTTGLQRSLDLSVHPFVATLTDNQWLQGIIVIVMTLAAASLVTWLLFKLAGKITRNTAIDLDDQVVELLRPPVYYSLLVTGIFYGLRLMPLADNISSSITRCIHTIGVFIWLLFFIRLATLLLNRVAGLSHRYTFIQRRTVTLFDNGAKVVIFSLGIYALFVIWQIDMTAWLASAGIAGIAIGFAAKDTLSNLFSGVFILADAPYKVGDYIVLDTGDRGKVRHIGLRSTRILTRDDVEVTIPNSIIGNSTIINQSGGPTEKFRIRIKVGVAYGTDIDEVRSILLAIARNEKLVCKSPAPRVRFRVFGASSLDFELLCWVTNPELRGRAMDALNDAVYKSFTRSNIEIPYSKQDLYIKGLPDALGLSAVRDAGQGGAAQQPVPED